MCNERRLKQSSSSHTFFYRRPLLPLNTNLFKRLLQSGGWLPRGSESSWKMAGASCRPPPLTLGFERETGSLALQQSSVCALRGRARQEESPEEMGLIQPAPPLFSKPASWELGTSSTRRRQHHRLRASSISPGPSGVGFFFFLSPFGLFSASREFQFPSKTKLIQIMGGEGVGKKVLAQLLLKEMPINSCTGACNSFR